MTAITRKEVAAEFDAMLARIGFTRTRYVHRTPLRPGVWGMVGVIVGGWGPGELSVDLIVAVRHDAVEEAMDSIRGRREEGAGYTVSMNLNVLRGEVPPDWFVVGPATPAPAVAARAEAELRRVALPFMESLADLEGLEAYAAADHPQAVLLHAGGFTVPLCRALRGDHTGACAALESLLARTVDLPDAEGYAERSRAYFAALEAAAGPATGSP